MIDQTLHSFARRSSSGLRWRWGERTLISKISKCIALFAFALLLAGCCAVGVGCEPPAGASVSSHGLASTTLEETEAGDPEPNKHGQAKRQTVPQHLDGAASQQNRRIEPKDSWEEQQAADQADEERLKRVLTICRNCLASEIASRSTATGRSDTSARSSIRATTPNN